MDKLRKEIDAIDEALMDLIDKRYKLTKAIGKYKQDHHLEVHNSNRETEVLEKADALVYSKEIKALYKQMFVHNKIYQGFKYGLMGKSLPYSLSPKIYEMLGLEDYKLLETDEFDKTISKLNYQGLNITNPHKTSAYQYCQKLDESARLTKTVNTIVNGIGYNTDYLALLDIFKKLNLDSGNHKVLIIGNGATSRSVKEAIKGNLVFLVRNIRNDNEYLISDYLRFNDYEFIINTTPYGTYPNLEEKPLFELSSFRNLKMVIDVVYNPLNSPLILEAKKYNIRTMNGLELLVTQANINYNLFMNDNIDRSLEVLNSLNKELFNIVIIGMPYSGKSTLAQELSKRLNKELVDIDQELKAENHDLNTLIKDNPISLFREYETEVAINRGMKFNQVIATGGGMVLSPTAMTALARNGIIVFLDCPLEVLTNRIDNTRPLIKSKSDLEKLYDERYQLYQKYSMVRITDASNIEDIVEKIYEYLNN